MLKRTFDIVVAACLLVVFAVPILLLSLLLLLTQGSPVFLRQRRPGYLDKPFVLVKFRTMAPDPNDWSCDEARRSDAQCDCGCTIPDGACGNDGCTEPGCVDNGCDRRNGCESGLTAVGDTCASNKTCPGLTLAARPVALPKARLIPS